MTKKLYDHNIITLALVKYAGVNPRAFDLLLKTFSSLDELLLAEDYELAEIEGISDSSAKRIAGVGDHLEEAASYSSELAKRNIRIITRFDTDYPLHLMEINDPPPLLYSRGRTPDVDLKAVALVGTEQATQPGIALTTKLAKALVSQKVQVLSSLGRGIDAAVHLGSKAAGGHSFAVIDGGFDHIVGEVEIPLAIDIIQTGGVLSEYAPEESVNGRNFKQSNRLIAGMAQAVVVTEFYENSNRIQDILEYCHQIGKLSFVMIDPEHGVLSDESSLALAVKFGAVLMTGLNRIDDIVKSLV
jgi:DNA processing protein